MATTSVRRLISPLMRSSGSKLCSSARCCGGKDKLGALQLDAQRAATGLEDAATRDGDAAATIAGLLDHAGVDEEGALAPALAANAQATRLLRDEADILAELAEAGDDTSLDELKAAAAALCVDEEIMKTARIASRNDQLQAKNEALLQSRTEARLAVELASIPTAAADAQQVAADATSSMTAAAERQIERAIWAALLRWLLDRHRQIAQGPLIARAGGISLR